MDAADTMFIQKSENVKSMIPLGILILGVIGVAKYYFTGSVLNADEITQEGFDADFETRHFWK